MVCAACLYRTPCALPAHCYTQIPSDFSLLFWFLLPVQFEGRHGDRVFDKRELRFEIGEGENFDIPHGLEKAIQKMEKSEESVFYLKPRYGVSLFVMCL